MPFLPEITESGLVRDEEYRRKIEFLKKRWISFNRRKARKVRKEAQVVVPTEQSVTV